MTKIHRAKREYSRADSVKVKARAGYTCQVCGSTEMVQAHAPNGDHSDWTKGIALCAEHHSREHPDVPKALFFTRGHQPYWHNKSAASMARELRVHSRTVIRAAKKLGIPPGELSHEDEQRLRDPIGPLRVKQAAEILHVHSNTIRRYDKLGILHSVRVGPGNQRRFRKAEVLALIELPTVQQ